jgi:hypothetical protein
MVTLTIEHGEQAQLSKAKRITGGSLRETADKRSWSYYYSHKSLEN